MANMMDYLLWRGDLSFKQAEFNEVDNLIFSELVYVDFDGIVPSLNEDKSITLKEASKIFFEHHTDEEIEAKVSSTKMAAFLMRAMARTKRFGNIELSNYINDINLKEQSLSELLFAFALIIQPEELQQDKHLHKRRTLRKHQRR